MWLSAIGWTAMAVFSSSYFFKEAATLAGSRPRQMPKPVINEGKNRSNPHDVRGRFAPLFASWYFLGHGSFSGDAARGRSERPS